MPLVVIISLLIGLAVERTVGNGFCGTILPAIPIFGIILLG